jgi:hypothetical protein
MTSLRATKTSAKISYAGARLTPSPRPAIPLGARIHISALSVRNQGQNRIL